MTTTTETVIDAARRLLESDTAYALVSVIRALPPASARPGDKAVVTADGQLHGWVGGGCAQPTVLRTVRQALEDGQARLVRIAPAAEGAESAEQVVSDVMEFAMSCHSGGTLELFVDPVLPRPRLVVVGASPVAQALVQLAPRVGFSVVLVAPGVDASAHPDAAQVLLSDDASDVLPRVGPGAWVVVATQGRRDVQGLRLALALRARQVSFVASATKAAVLKRSLIDAGSNAAAVQAIVAPAGYPMAAQTPQEIALSVLAAVVSSRRTRPAQAEVPRAAEPVDMAPRAEVAPVGVGVGVGAVVAEAASPGTAAAPRRSCCGS